MAGVGPQVTPFSGRALAEADEVKVAMGRIAAAREAAGHTRRLASMDPRTSVDLDDGFWVVKRDFGWRVFVGIVDVSEIFNGHPALTDEVSDRAFTRYGPHAPVFMLPDVLAKDGASLLPQALRPVVTTVMDFDHRGNRIAARWLLEAGMNVHRFAYQDAPGALARGDGVGEMLRHASDLARALEANRRGQGSTVFYDFEHNVVTNEDGLPIVIPAGLATEGYRIVQELMIATGRANAEMSIELALDVLYRNHIRRIVGEDTELVRVINMARLHPEGEDMARLRQTLSLIYAPADYGLMPLGHAGLKQGAHMHVTSTGRRLPDALSQAAIVAYKQNRASPIDREQLERYKDHVNEVAAEQRRQAGDRAMRRVHAQRLAAGGPDALNVRIKQALDGDLRSLGAIAPQIVAGLSEGVVEPKYVSRLVLAASTSDEIGEDVRGALAELMLQEPAVAAQAFNMGGQRLRWTSEESTPPGTNDVTITIRGPGVLAHATARSSARTEGRNLARAGALCAAMHVEVDPARLGFGPRPPVAPGTRAVVVEPVPKSIKNELQELTVAAGLGVPTYTTPGDQPPFVSTLDIHTEDDRGIFHGQGTRRSAAESDAAARALDERGDDLRAMVARTRGRTEQRNSKGELLELCARAQLAPPTWETPQIQPPFESILDLGLGGQDSIFVGQSNETRIAAEQRAAMQALAARGDELRALGARGRKAPEVVHSTSGAAYVPVEPAHGNYVGAVITWIQRNEPDPDKKPKYMPAQDGVSGLWNVTGTLEVAEGPLVYVRAAQTAKVATSQVARRILRELNRVGKARSEGRVHIPAQEGPGSGEGPTQPGSGGSGGTGGGGVRPSGGPGTGGGAAHGHGQVGHRRRADLRPVAERDGQPLQRGVPGSAGDASRADALSAPGRRKGRDGNEHGERKQGGDVVAEVAQAEPAVLELSSPGGALGSR